MFNSVLNSRRVFAMDLMGTYAFCHQNVGGLNHRLAMFSHAEPWDACGS